MASFELFIFLISNFIIMSKSLGFRTNMSALMEITPSTASGGKYVGFYKVGDNLNLTCSLKNSTHLQNFMVEWDSLPSGFNSDRVYMQRASSSLISIIVKPLHENDSGNYSCRVVNNGFPDLTFQKTVYISVKNKRRECTDSMFRCSDFICIPKRYTCDGQNDCPNGEDELPSYCGPGDSCDNKLMCPDSRCIPFTWCCDLYKESNCTAKVKHSCCSQFEKLTRENDAGSQFERDMGFLQTTVYTVIGCAMAFMFIVTIIVIAICRVRVRHSFLSRCPAARRNSAFDQDGNIYGNQLNGLSFYDIDLYFNRPGFSRNDLMSVNPLLVTYNINNGVQFVRRPIDPPPYCEIVTSPAKEGPPPSYTSHEDLSVRFDCNQVEGPKIENREALLDDSADDIEMTETDALLGSARANNSSAIDILSLSEEILSSEYLDEPEASFSSNMKNKDISIITEDVSENGKHSDSSLAGILLNSSNPLTSITENFDILKVQSEESSSYVTNGVDGKPKKTTYPVHPSV